MRTPTQLYGALLITALLGATGCAGGASQSGSATAPPEPQSSAPAAETAAVATSESASAPSASTASAETGEECGGASYYADKFIGRPTASGEPYSATRMTAAHRTLPFGAVVSVAMEGGGVVEVTINDRGPFIEGRVIDLSRAAADKIGLIQAGVAPVCIKVIERPA
ncbi:MAG: septal ring lytic transglycosylase RlpA family protein [Pseudomonadota bacterium]